MLECMPIYDVFLFCTNLFAPFRGKVVQNCLFGATTHKNIDFTALNAGIRRERKKYFWHHLYHRDHGGRLIPASYVVPKINEYLILRNIYFFAPKSLLASWWGPLLGKDLSDAWRSPNERSVRLPSQLNDTRGGQRV